MNEEFNERLAASAARKRDEFAAAGDDEGEARWERNRRRALAGEIKPVKVELEDKPLRGWEPW